ncbi:MAG: FkbM family methyltransferase [Pseudolabrys sp.]
MRRLPHRRRTVDMRGQQLSIDPSESSGFYLYYEREYDDQIFNFLNSIIGRYVVALDIGANIGVYTCYLAARVPQVIAFEPDPAVCAWLRSNLALNRLNNVTVHQACVGREKGMVKFFSAEDRNSGIGSMIDAPGASREMPCVCLDDLFQPPFGPCLIKLDIEGAEWLALQGARRLLSAPDVSVDILMEVHPEQLQKAGVSLHDLHALLAQMGYQIFGIGTGGLIPLPPQARGERFWWATRSPVQSNSRPR